MSLPINIESLVHGKAVEWERLEFKRGWNPEEIVHTLCAFANDLNNWGGGYIIVGIEENKGQPVLPPYGLPAEQLDHIQGEIVQLAYQLQPSYFPIVQPYILQDNGATNGATNGADKEVNERVSAIIEKQIHNRVAEVLILLKEWKRRGKLFSEMKLSNQSYNREKYLDPLLDNEFIEMEFPDSTTHPNQRYKTSPLGKALLKIIENK